MGDDAAGQGINGTGENAPGQEPATIWMRPERPSRPLPGPQRTHSRKQIAAAAIEIADAEGLDAASMRQIAAKIGAGAMTLYHYIGSREDLIELMVDMVTGEMNLPDPPSGDWRAQITHVAREKRALWLRHPWLAARLPGHPIWGPNSLRVQEFMLGALDGFDLSMDEVVTMVALINGYVDSFVRAEVGWTEETRRTKVEIQEWMRWAAPHAREIVVSGKYPMFARVLMETSTPRMDPDERFEHGMTIVLDSIAANL